jgi:hypothetical protein
MDQNVPGLFSGIITLLFGDYYYTWIVFGAYYVTFWGLLLYLDSFRGLLRCFSGIITVPG